MTVRNAVRRKENTEGAGGKPWLIDKQLAKLANAAENQIRDSAKAGIGGGGRDKPKSEKGSFYSLANIIPPFTALIITYGHG
jgi:hypothetical protein